MFNTLGLSHQKNTVYGTQDTSWGWENNSQPRNYPKEMNDAIRAGRLNNVAHLITSLEVDLEEILDEHTGNTPLLTAIDQGKSEIALFLIEAGADVFVSNEQGMNTLIKTVQKSHLFGSQASKVISKLIEKGMSPNQSDSSGKTPLMYACKKGRTALIDTLVKLGASVHARSRDGETTLMAAVREDNPKAIDQLISYGADIEACTSENINAFQLAIEENRADVFYHFVDKLKLDINQKDWFGATPLIWAACQKRSNFFEELINRGANLNAKTTKPISFTMKRPGDLFASFYPNIKTIPAGSTAYKFAQEFDFAEGVRLLEKKGITQ